MTVSRPSEAPLTRAQAEDVLRYYREALKLEEALDVRPKARRVAGGSSVPRIDVPTPGQEYFKVPLEGGVAELLGERKTLARAFDAELAQFFETWLHGQYRRSEEEGELSHLLCFPVVHLPRGELAGLLRYCVRLRFAGTAGESFRPPVRAERERGLFPAPPVEARIATVLRDEGAWPFFVDTRLLRHPLGVPSESVDALFDALRAREQVSEQLMLSLVTRLLEHTVRDTRGEGHEALLRALSAPASDAVEALLPRLCGAMETLLGQGRVRARVYAVGVVVDGSAAKTTFHLQRELASLLQQGVPNAGALSSYLTGKPGPSGRVSQRALFDAPPLTAHQRKAAETFWGSPLTAVQGPPGTGKTTLILHLCAEAVLRKVEAFVDTGAMGEDVLLVTSSNNRAVDNVVEGLERDDLLPLALRGGSRQVSEDVLARQLRRTLQWLEPAAREPATTRALSLARAVDEFGAARAALSTLLAPRLAAERSQSEHARLEAALHDWDAEQLAAADAHETAFAGVPDTEVAPLLEALLPLEKRLLALGRLCEATPGLAQVNAVARHYGRTAGAEQVAFEAALGRAGLTLALPLPPLVTPMAPAALMEAWEDATEQCLGELGQLRDELERKLRARRLLGTRVELLGALAALGEPVMVVPDAPVHDDESRRLFACALAVREAWARTRATELCGAISSALRALDEERTLRPLFRADPESARWLTRLFGVWGVTLLSLGNCFPPDAESVAHVVIDEAGQCHPAHAVSALLRARSALVIGDVHQLAPVVELSADDELRLFTACKLKTRPEQLVPYRVHASAHVSAQSLADRAVETRLVLVDHFRCQRDIIAISDALCGYGLRVHTAPATRSHEVSLLHHSLLFHHLEGSQERLGSSLVNELELRDVLKLVGRFLTEGVRPCDLAVITPYRGQLELLRRGLVEQGVPLEYSQELMEGDAPPRAHTGVALGTVHRFQGGERSIVLFSSVVTRDGSLGFLNARPNLLNVAVSRARHHFVALGHGPVLSRGPRTRLLVDGARPLFNRG